MLALVVCPARMSLTRMAGFAGAGRVVHVRCAYGSWAGSVRECELSSRSRAPRGQGGWRDSPRMAWMLTTLMVSFNHPCLALLAALSLAGLVL
jgi:hypothetical protein